MGRSKVHPISKSQLKSDRPHAIIPQNPVKKKASVSTAEGKLHNLGKQSRRPKEITVQEGQSLVMRHPGNSN